MHEGGEGHGDRRGAWLDTLPVERVPALQYLNVVEDPEVAGHHLLCPRIPDLAGKPGPVDAV